MIGVGPVITGSTVFSATWPFPRLSELPLANSIRGITTDPDRKMKLESTEYTAEAPIDHDPDERVAVAVALLFLLSGATSLTYQVAWTRMLSLFFGSDVYAAAITLSVFMGGLSLGSWLGGFWGDNLRRPLLTYGLCEIAIAGCAFAFPVVLSGFEGVYREVYRTRFEADPALYHGLRVAIAAAVLLVPTLLMGATLPLIIRQFAVSAEILGQRVGKFYAINTLGALLGTLITGFILLPLIGVSRTVLASLAVNLAIGIVAVVLGLHIPGEPVRRAATSSTRASPSPLTFPLQKVVLVIGLSGFAALALEVVWLRILVQSFSATVYAYSIMLSCFLFGIFYGSRRAAKIIDKQDNLKDLLVALELWLGVAVALLAIFAYVVPGLFGGLLWGLTGMTSGAFGVASVLAQFIVASILILGPTIMLGATFPIAVKIYTSDVCWRARGTGVIYGANTVGAMFGALGAGFILLPAMGTRVSLLVIAGVFIVAGLLMAYVGRNPDSQAMPKRRLIATLGLTMASVVVVASLPPQTVVNFNLQRSTAPNIVFHSEGVSHTVDIIKNDAGQTIMMINGNIEADTTLIQRRHFILKGHLPLLLHSNPKTVAVVGLGLGVTLGATTRFPTVRTIRLIELSPSMIEAHEHLRDITGGVLDNPKVKLRIDDGRNFMAMTAERFDVITTDPVHPRITGVGYLYSREYFQQMRNRLRPGGVVSQWMPMYHISKESFDAALRTFVEVFPNTTFWYVRNHGLLIGTLEGGAIDYQRLAKRFADPAVTKDLASIGMPTPEALLGHLLMDAEHIGRYLAQSNRHQINTDDNAYLEYRTPFEFIERTESIVDGLLPFAGWDVEKRLENASEIVKAEVRRQFQHRLDRIKPELSEPVK